MIMRDYHINLFYSEEDEGYIADIPDLKLCSAFRIISRRSTSGSAQSQRSLA
jgi:hypothetical protein